MTKCANLEEASNNRHTISNNIRTPMRIEGLRVILTKTIKINRISSSTINNQPIGLIQLIRIRSHTQHTHTTIQTKKETKKVNNYPHMKTCNKVYKTNNPNQQQQQQQNPYFSHEMAEEIFK